MKLTLSEWTEYVPEWMDNRDEDPENQIVVLIKPMSWTTEKDFEGKMYKNAVKRGKFNDKAASDGVKRKFLKHVGEITNLEINEIKLTKAIEIYENEFTRELVAEISEALMSMSKLTEGDLKNLS